MVLREALAFVVDNRGKNPPLSDDGYPVIEGNAITQTNRFPQYEKVRKFVSKATYETWFRKGHPKLNDILFVTVGGIGTVALMDEREACVAQNIIALRFKEEYDARFYYYYFKQQRMQEFFQSLDISSVQPSIKVPHLLGIEIPVFDLSRQEAVAAVLSSLDDKIALLDRQNGTLEALAETLFRKRFVEEAYGSEDEVPLERVCVRIASGGTPSTKVEGYYGGTINWYSTKELNDNYLFESVSKITEAGLQNSAAKLFPENTIVIAIYAAPTVGRLGLLGNEASFNQAACGLVADEGKVCFEYLYLHLLSSRQTLNDMASGSAQQNLNVGIMKAFPIIQPSKEEMAEFRNAIRPMFKKIKSNTNQIRKLTELRDALLPKLMNGEVCVESSQ